MFPTPATFSKDNILTLKQIDQYTILSHQGALDYPSLTYMVHSKSVSFACHLLAYVLAPQHNPSHDKKPFFSTPN